MVNEVHKALQILKEGKTLLYPTDTVWGLGCDATNNNAIAKIYQIKQRAESKSLIVLVDSLEMLANYVERIPEKALEIIKKTDRPTTIIYQNPKNLASKVIANDHTVAIRITSNVFCQNLIAAYKKPIVSTSANISGNATPMSFKEIDTAILNSVDYVVNLHQNKVATQSSKIVKILEDGSVHVLRA